MTIVQNGKRLDIVNFPANAIPIDFSKKLSHLGDISAVNTLNPFSSFSIHMHNNVSVEKVQRELEDYERIYNQSDRA